MGLSECACSPVEAGFLETAEFIVGVREEFCLDLVPAPGALEDGGPDVACAVFRGKIDALNVVTVLRADADIVSLSGLSGLGS